MRDMRRLTSSSAEQARREIVQVAPPGLPLVVRPRRLDVDVVDPGVGERLVEAADALAHPFRLRRADAQPEHPHLLGKRFRIGEGAVEVRPGVEGPAAQTAGAAEPAYMRKEVEAVEGD